MIHISQGFSTELEFKLQDCNRGKRNGNLEQIFDYYFKLTAIKTSTHTFVPMVAQIDVTKHI